MYAAKKGLANVVLFLIQNGADVNIQTRKGKTALMYAAERGHVEVLLLLIQKWGRIKRN